MKEMFSSLRDVVFSLNKKIFIALALCSVFSVSVYIYSGLGNQGVRVNVRSISEDSELYTIQAEYPQFGGVSKKFNASISATVIGDISEFKKTIGEFGNTTLKEKLVLRDGKYIFQMTWVSDQINTDWISIALREYTYTGGAHGLGGVQTFTYDMKKKSEVTLPTIFGDDTGYLGRISGFVASDLKNQMGTEAVMDMIREGTTPKIQNFEQFTLSRDGIITFYFAPYQVAPFSAGEFTVRMPRTYMKE